jgi:branched-chain amino acid transport system substrate-binding protein
MEDNLKKRFYISILLIFIFTSLMYGCNKSSEVKPVEKTDDPQIIETDENDLSTYKIGVAAPITGSWAKYGKGFKVATTLAIENINKNGGVKGRKLALVISDSKGDTKQAVKVADKFVNDKNTLAVVGDYSSACCMVTAPIYEHKGHGMVQLSPSAGSKDFAGVNEYMFSIVGDKNDEATFIARELIGKYIGAKKLSIIYLDNDWGKNTTQIISNEWEAMEYELTYCEGYKDGVEDFKDLLEEARKTKPQALCLVMYYNDLINILNQIKEMEWDIPVCNIGSGASQKTIELGNKDVEGVMTVTPFIVSAKDKEIYNLASEFEKRAGFKLNMKSACAYDAVFLIADAMENCEEVTRQGIANELAKIKGFDGITGQITFNKNGGINRQYRIAKVVNGEWEPVTEYK